jgi:hypothetical protein
MEKKLKTKKDIYIKNIFNHTRGLNRSKTVLSLLKWEGKYWYNVKLTKEYSQISVVPIKIRGPNSDAPNFFCDQRPQILMDQIKNK